MCSIWLNQSNNHLVSNTTYIGSASDLPTAVGGVITLDANTAYIFTTTVNLGTSRLVCGMNTTILGYSSEVSKITSTLGTGVALITSTYTMPMRDIELSVSGSGAIILALDATGNSNQALDWYGVNFNGGIIGTITNYNNVIITSTAVLSAVNGFSFGGTIGTIAFNQSIFSSISSGGTYISLLNTLVITRRFRIIYSSFIVPTGATGISVHASTTIPVESFILDATNWSGIGTYLSGITSSDNKSSILNTKGLTNTASVGYLYMVSNATTTTVDTQNTYYSISGTFSAGTVNQRFTQSTSKLTYIGAISRIFNINSLTTLTSGNNQVIKIALYKNGSIIVDSEQSTTTNGSGRTENIGVQTFLVCVLNDEFEVRVNNTSAINDITVVSGSISIHELA